MFYSFDFKGCFTRAARGSIHFNGPAKPGQNTPHLDKIPQLGELFPQFFP